MNTIVKLTNVDFRRGEKDILTNIHWEMQEGENWGILGLNGSGKTSLLNIVSTYEIPSKGGQVEILGKTIGQTYVPELRKSIGYVSSSLDKFSQFFHNETIERIVVSGKFASFGIYDKVEPQDWERVDVILTHLRLTYLKGKVYHQLSEGEKRRVLIARSFMSDPKILILDEPCSGLDILSRESFLSGLKELKKDDCHFIYVTHHIEELVEDITHVLLLKDGKILAAGEKENILTANLLTEAFKVPIEVRWESGRPWLSVKSETMQRQI